MLLYTPSKTPKVVSKWWLNPRLDYFLNWSLIVRVPIYEFHIVSYCSAFDAKWWSNGQPNVWTVETKTRTRKMDRMTRHCYCRHRYTYIHIRASHPNWDFCQIKPGLQKLQHLNSKQVAVVKCRSNVMKPWRAMGVRKKNRNLKMVTWQEKLYDFSVFFKVRLGFCVLKIGLTSHLQDRLRSTLIQNLLAPMILVMARLMSIPTPAALARKWWTA